jgi:hypothetical protein
MCKTSTRDYTLRDARTWGGRPALHTWSSTDRGERRTHCVDRIRFWHDRPQRRRRRGASRPCSPADHHDTSEAADAVTQYQPRELNSRPLAWHSDARGIWAPSAEWPTRRSLGVRRAPHTPFVRCCRAPHAPDLGHAQRMVAAANQHRAVHANPLGPHLLASARRPPNCFGKEQCHGVPPAPRLQLPTPLGASRRRQRNQACWIDELRTGAPRRVLRNRHIGDDGASSRDQVGLVRPGRGSRQPAYCSRSPPMPLRPP